MTVGGRALVTICTAVRVYGVDNCAVTGIGISTAREARSDRVTYATKSHDIGANAAAEGQITLVGAREVCDPLRAFHTLKA